MSTATMTTLLRYLVETYGVGRKFTNTGTSASALTSDGDFGGPGAAERVDVGCAVIIDEKGDASVTAPFGSISRLSTRPALTTGTASVDPNFSAALANADKGVVIYEPLRVSGGGGFYDVVNQALQEFVWERRLVPVSLFPDADMLKSGVTNWVTDDAASLSKATLAFPGGFRYISGSINFAGADFLTAAANVAVEAGESYYLEATLGMNAGASQTYEMFFRDITGSANVTPTGTYVTMSRTEVQILSGNVTAPSGCESANIRLVPGVNNNAIFVTNIILRKNKAKRFTVQDRPTGIHHLGKLLATSEPNYERRSHMDEVHSRLEQLQDNMWEYRTDHDLSGYSVWHEEFIVPATVDSLDDTTSIPIPHLAAVVAERWLRPVADSKLWARKYEMAVATAARVRQQYASLRTVRGAEQRTIVLPRV